ncbi:hypothetical protein [Phenylobacterium sp.]|uniref:hypothetical protein n=1 Tax=Phenylobacterium sp. TaxID=1871053 RepID=UPI0025F004D2|nr:hypothetical protein [Phenylobacterium sp.]
MLYGAKTPNASGTGQVDLAAVFRAAGSTIPSGTQEWEVSLVTGTGTHFRYNSGTNPLTATGYTGTGNTGRTPYRSTAATDPKYEWDYRVRVDGGAWSNWGRLTYNMVSSGVSIGNNYSGDNYAGAILGTADAAQAYTNGVRVLYLMTGLSRPDFRMGAGFNFSSGTGWSTSDRLKVMWANNQLPPTLSAISFGGGSSGIWVDLEYDGVTVTGGRLVGYNANVSGKVQIAGDDNRVTRINALMTEAEFTTEFINYAQAAVYLSGNRNEIGVEGDYSQANYASHVSNAFYVSGGTGNKVCNNVLAYFHARGIAREINTSGTIVRYNLVGPAWRTRSPTVDKDIHLDSIWSPDNSGGVVEQSPTIENNLIWNLTDDTANISSCRLIVLGATGASLDIATPTVRGNIVIAPYTYGIELGRWSGSCRFTHNTLITAIKGDYSVDINNIIPLGSGQPDYGNASMRIVCKPLTLVAAATMTSDKNYLWSQREYGDGTGGYANVLGVTTGTDIANNRSNSPTGFPGGLNPRTTLEASAGSIWTMPTKAADITAMLNYVWGVLYRTDGYGAVNSTGTGWATLP